MADRKDYKTRQRELVLRCFADQPRRSLSAQKVCQCLAQGGHTVGRTTVYRTIARLAQTGLITAIPEGLGTGPARYQHRGQQRHISVRCTGCGTIAELTCRAVTDFEDHLYSDHGFSLQEEECLLPGLCSTCAPQDLETKGTL